jgi:hypothetical protein
VLPSDSTRGAQLACGPHPVFDVVSLADQLAAFDGVDVDGEDFEPRAPTGHARLATSWPKPAIALTTSSRGLPTIGRDLQNQRWCNGKGGPNHLLGENGGRGRALHGVRNPAGGESTPL